MDVREELLRVRTLSDQGVLAGLSGVLGSSRQLVALLIVHLGEVEVRRLHLIAGHGSMFAYCTERLGMSEDEAYRRIEVARLARSFPMLLERIARGLISMSVAALLKGHLDESNHVALLDAVGGKTVKQAREVLAAWFPQPDVCASIRKLPRRRVRASSVGDASAPSDAPSLFADEPAARAPVADSAPLTGTPAPSRAKRAAFEFEPLAPERYKVVFTADGDLKRRLDLARDLLRHSIPQGELAAIIGRALDLLLEKTLQRRFAKTKRSKPRTAATLEPARTSITSTTVPATESIDAEPVVAQGHVPTAPCPPLAPSPAPAQPPPKPHPHPSRHIPNATRRAVLERDGLRCTWIAPDGLRCNSRAWLEHDHGMPRGLGGDDAPSNIRMRCRAHNRLAAEQAYGQPSIERIIAQRRARKGRDPVADADDGEGDA